MYKKRKHIFFMCFTLVGVWIIVIHCIILLLIANTRSKVSLIIFKLPRTGSTWFTELINRYADVYISKEIIQSKDFHSFSPYHRLSYLIKALHQPCGKLSHQMDWLPDGRYIRDYLYSMKWYNSVKVIGFTINPEYCTDIDWKALVAASHNMKIIIYKRSNLVKTAISAILGKMTKRMCKSSNLKALGSCHLPTSLNISIPMLLKELQLWKNRNEQFDIFYKSIHEIFQKIPVILIYYEDLLSNPHETFQYIDEFLEFNHLSTASMTQYQSEWKKRTSSHLKHVIFNYHEIIQALPNTFWQQQFIDEHEKIFVSASNQDSFKNRSLSFHKNLSRLILEK